MSNDASDADDTNDDAGGLAHDDGHGRFSAWYPVEHAGQHTPSAPGVFQIRQARGLCVYPRGKSAMLFYGCAADLLAGVRDFRARHPGPAGQQLCRHRVFDEELTAESLYLDVLARFHTRFGALPRLHAGAGEPAR